MAFLTTSLGFRIDRNIIIIITRSFIHFTDCSALHCSIHLFSYCCKYANKSSSFFLLLHLLITNYSFRTALFITANSTWPKTNRKMTSAAMLYMYATSVVLFTITGACAHAHYISLSTVDPLAKQIHHALFTRQTRRSRQGSFTQQWQKNEGDCRKYFYISVIYLLQLHSTDEKWRDNKAFGVNSRWCGDAIHTQNEAEDIDVL